MNNATPQRISRTGIDHSFAVLAAGTLIAIAVVVTALLGPGKSPRLVANPQGGIWVERGGLLYLCRPRQQAAGACINLLDGSTVAYADIAG